MSDISNAFIAFFCQDQDKYRWIQPRVRSIGQLKAISIKGLKDLGIEDGSLSVANLVVDIALP
ncbi:MAG: hypothetical protein Kow00121_17180 [Elainellaceae cyanobacterium]